MTWSSKIAITPELTTCRMPTPNPTLLGLPATRLSNDCSNYEKRKGRKVKVLFPNLGKVLPNEEEQQFH